MPEFDYSKLLGRIKEKYGTQENYARIAGMSRTSLSLKVNNKADFNKRQIFEACTLLDISDSEIGVYFFTPKVQKHELLIANE